MMEAPKFDLQKLLDGMQTFVGVLDKDGRLIFVNNSPLVAAGIEEKEVIGKYLWDCFWFSHDDELQAIIAMDCRKVANGETVLNEVQVRMRDGLMWVEFSMHPVYDEQGNVINMVPEGRDITERKKAEQALRQLNIELETRVAERTKELVEANCQFKVLSETDPLTKIANRRVYKWQLNENIAAATRGSQYLSLLMIDIDCFKEYNDHYGHDLGDFALKCVAETISDTLPRQTDLVARFGGEEFVVLLPITDSDGAFEVAEKIRVRVKAQAIEHDCSNACSVITVSIGIASLQGDELKEDDLLKLADNALYAAKNNGRNQCQVINDCPAVPS